MAVILPKGPLAMSKSLNHSVARWADFANLIRLFELVRSKIDTCHRASQK